MNYVRGFLRAAGWLLLVAVLVGASVWYMTGRHFVKPELVNGPWVGSRLLANPDAGPYTKAYFARLAWFGLPDEETIYFEAIRDSELSLLNPDCSYHITVPDLDARWWSITAYRNLHWMPNDLNRYSFTSQLTKPVDMRSEITFSKRQHEGNWLPIDDAVGDLSLVLRLYNPSIKLQNDYESAAFPRIVKGECE